MKKILFIWGFCVLGNVFAQNFTIRGVLVDKKTQKPLESATIHAENPSDNSLITYTISDKKGNFKLSGNTRIADIQLIISFVGYASEKRKVKIDKKEIQLGIIFLTEKATRLEGVEVVGTRPPVVVKKDTLEFNADSFKTRSDASVEELLKQLPGIEVDTDGVIKVNGKNVKEILVNGKPFFGSDPKIATKNLTKDIVNKIQVTDYNSKENKFIGKKEETEEKSINILLKEDKNKGFFGQITGGYGTNKRYETNGMLNTFKKTRQISVLGSTNNINGQGLATNSDIGVNFAGEIDKNTQLSADYKYDNQQNTSQIKTQREYLLPNRHYFNNTESWQYSENNSHKASTSFEYLQGNFIIIWSPSFSFKDQTTSRTGVTESLNENKELVNQNKSKSFSEETSNDFSSRMSINYKWGEKGGGLLLLFNNSNSEELQESSIENDRIIQGDQVFEKQNENTKDKSDVYGTSLTVRQPIIGKWLLETSYSFRNARQTNLRNNYSVDAFGEYSVFNTEQSSKFLTLNQTHNPSVGVQFRNDKWFLTVSVGSLFSRLFNEDYLQGGSFDKNFQNMMFRSRINYRMNTRRGVTFSYQTRVNNPSVMQLQPIINISNPLYIVQGNPNLNREYSHSVYADYFSFNEANQVSLQSYLNFSATEDKVIAKTLTDEKLIRTTTYENVNGNYNLNANILVSKQFRFDKNKILLRLGTRYSFDKSKQYFNEKLLTPFAQTVRLNPSFSVYLDNLMNAEMGYSMSYSKTDYNFDFFQNRSVITQNAYLKTNFTFGNIVLWDNEFSFNHNPSVSSGFKNSFFFWNMSLGVKFNENATLRLKAYDVLKQNINTTRLVSSDFIQDTETTVLQQYFLLSFTYKFGVFAGQKVRSEGNQRRFSPNGIRNFSRPML